MIESYKDKFMQAMTQAFKELEQHGTWIIVSGNSVTGAHILPITWYFKVKCFTDGRLCKFRAIFCARGDRKVEVLDQRKIAVYSSPLDYVPVLRLSN